MQQNKIKLYVIGDPIKHSLSPIMHNAALQKFKLDGTYQKKRVELKNLALFCQNIKSSNCMGFNITLPHKIDILPYLDQISLEALHIGAVNTVLIRNKKLLGFNTDGQGYLQSLLEQYPIDFPKIKILLLGAGGAARGLAYTFLENKVKELIIANRNLAKAESLKKDLLKIYPQAKIKTVILCSKELSPILKKIQLLVNATSIGLNGSEFENFPYNMISQDCIVSDIVYQPRFTPLLKAAKKRKLKIHTGEGMLAYQGALAFEIWTGIKAPGKFMHRALLKELRSK